MTDHLPERRTDLERDLQAAIDEVKAGWRPDDVLAAADGRIDGLANVAGLLDDFSPIGLSHPPAQSLSVDPPLPAHGCGGTLAPPAA